MMTSVKNKSSEGSKGARTNGNGGYAEFDRSNLPPNRTPPDILRGKTEQLRMECIGTHEKVKTGQIQYVSDMV